MFRLDITPEAAQSLADELSHAAEAGLFHPSIVEPIAAGVEGTVAYRAEEYVAAETLDVAMRHFAPAPIDKALPVITQLAGAIDFARAAGVGHGALHPRDVFVTPEETRVTGFGVVDALERVGIRAPVRRPYSAPERIEGAEWGTPADVFALGAIAYELLSGRRPAGIGREIGALPSGAGPHPEALLAVLMAAMDPNPGRRFPTALAFASALEGAVRGDAPLEKVAAPTRSAGPGAATAAAAAAATPTVLDEPEDPSLDDILDERDDDAAHHELLIREREAEEAVPLFADIESRDEDVEPEAEADRLMSEAEADRLIMDAAAVASDEPTERYREEFSAPLRDGPAMRGRPVESAERTYDEPAVVPQRRSRALPLAAMLSLGLLVGFAAGYGVGARQPSDPAERTEGPAAAPASEAPRQTAGRDYSEGTVATPAGSPAAAPPSVPAQQPPQSAATRDPAGTRGGAVPPSAAAAADRAERPRPTAAGRLVVQSVPTRAGVMLNGRWRGRTPLTLERLPFGRHSVRVVQPGYAAAQREVALSEGDPAETLSIRLQRQAASRAPQSSPRADETSEARTFTGSIYVDSRPRGARVILDGRPVGTTPVRIPEVRIGAHVVRLELPDHRPWSSSTRVTAGELVRVTGSLERIP